MKKSAVALFFAAFLSITAIAQTVQEGVSNFHAERFQSAKSVFEKLIAANPNNLEAVYWLGQTQIATGDLNGARSLYQKSLTANGNAPLIMAGMGHVNLLDGKAAEARQLFESAITTSRGKKGNDPNILTAVGRANVRAFTEKKPVGDLDYAISKLNEAAQLAPTNPEVFLNLGNAYRKKHLGGEAIQAYRKAVNYAPAIYRTASLYQTQSNWEVVVENLNAAIAADPKFAPAYYELYNYYLNNKRDFATAEKYANQYRNVADPSVENEYLIAGVLYVQNKYAEAISIGKKILSEATNPNNRVYRLLANSYIESKDTANACQYSNMFLSKASEEEVIGNDYLLHAAACGKNNPDLIRSDITKAVQIDSVPSRQIALLYTAIENARKAGQRELEGELGLFRYKFQNKTKEKPEEFIALGAPFLFGGNFRKADSLFRLYTVAFPDSIYGFYWSSRALRQLDPETTQGLAIPAYEQTLRIAEADPTRQFYKDAGTSAAIQLAVYYINVKKDREKGLSYTDRGLRINPADESLLSIKNQLTPKSAPKTEIKQKLESDKSKTKVKNGK